MILLLKATPAQQSAGNYPKRKVRWRGLTISIENEAGSERSGIDRHGQPWSIAMSAPYGYINRTTGADGDQVDVYLGPDLDAPQVYIIHQRGGPGFVFFDEDKCMVGFRSKADAMACYMRHYDKPNFMGEVTTMAADEFAARCKKKRPRPVFFLSHLVNR